MTSEPILSLLLPFFGGETDLAGTLKSIRAVADQVQLIAVGDLPDVDDPPHYVTLPGNREEHLGTLLNRTAPHMLGEFVSLIAPGVEIAPGLPDAVRNAAEQPDSPDYLYGCYDQLDEKGKPSRVETNVCPDDVTEREDWGALEFYRVSALRALGGCHPGVRFRADYDLRLQLTAEHPALRLPEAICTVPFSPSDEAPGAESLYFPGRGRLGGFSYLFMDPGEEMEVELIFTRALKQRNAYLEQPSGARFSPPEGGSPRVSVIIPVHNRAGFLPLAVQSVQQGTFEDFEVIVVDNASEDGTLAVAQNLAEEDPRIKIIGLPDNVIARALNAGLREARGEYIAQLDSDDEYTPDTLSAMVAALDEHLDWALAISYYELMDEEGQTLREFGVIKHLEYDRNNILRVDGAGALRCWRKAAIEEFGGFDEEDFGHYGEDYDLVLKVGEKYEVGRVHQVLYRYRRHPGNSDVLRPHELKIKNKTLARQRAIERRRIINQRR